MKKRKSNFVIQGSILAIAGILSRLIGIVRRFPMEHIIGDKGNGYYSAAYEVYSIILIISCYSLPLAVSKVVSQKITKKQYINAQRVFRCAMLFAVIVGGLTFAIVEIFGDFIASEIVYEPMSSFALKVLGPALLLVAVMGVFRGYFQGLGTMIPTAVSQIVEQIFVMIATIIGAYYLYNRGAVIGDFLHDPNYAPAYGAAGASLGPVIGAVAGLLFLIFVFVAYRSNVKRQVENDVTGVVDDYKTLFRLILVTILPVLLSSTVYNISTFIDISIYNRIMVAKGLEDVKAYNLGVYTGKYRVLVNVPIALANAMCSSIVPVLTGLMVEKKIKEAKERIDQGMRFTMIIAIPCMVGLAVLARPVISMLFRGEVDLAVELLHVGSVSVLFYSMSTLTNGVLQGINKMKIPVRNAFIALVVHVAFLYVTLQLGWGVHAMVYANILLALIVSVLNAIAIRKYFNYHQEIIKTFIIPGISALIMGVVIGGLNYLINGFAGNIVSVIVCITLGCIVYFAALILLKGVDEKDLRKMPGGKTVLSIAKKCKLIKSYKNE